MFLSKNEVTEMVKVTLVACFNGFIDVKTREYRIFFRTKKKSAPKYKSHKISAKDLYILTSSTNCIILRTVSIIER